MQRSIIQETKNEAPRFNIPKNIKKIKLIFDVNGTVMSGDTEKAKNEAKKNVKSDQDLIKLQHEYMSRVLWKTLAENYTGLCPDGSNKNFRDYLEEKHKIGPGKKLSTEQYYTEFTTFIAAHNPKLLEANTAFVEHTIQQFEKGFVFTSFICLLDELKKTNIQVELILRTFGSDGESVIDELAKRTELFSTVIETDHQGKEKKKITGVIRGTIDAHGLLNILDKRIDPGQLDKEISSSSSHIVLIRDNYNRWSDHQGQYTDFGKPIYIDTTDPDVLIGVFDDNMKVVGNPKRGGIISVQTNALGADRLSQEKLQELLTAQYFLFNVNELTAIQSNNYYSELFNLMLTQKLHPNMLLDVRTAPQDNTVAPVQNSVLSVSEALNTPGIGTFAQAPVPLVPQEAAEKAASFHPATF